MLWCSGGSVVGNNCGSACWSELSGRSAAGGSTVTDGVGTFRFYSHVRVFPDQRAKSRASSEVVLRMRRLISRPSTKRLVNRQILQAHSNRRVFFHSN